MPVAFTIRYYREYCLIPADLLQVVVSFDAYAHHERKQHWKSSDGPVSKRRKNAVGIGVCPAAAKAAAIGAGGFVSPLHALAAVGKNIPRLSSAGGRRVFPEIRRIF